MKLAQWQCDHALLNQRATPQQRSLRQSSCVRIKRRHRAPLAATRAMAERQVQQLDQIVEEVYRYSDLTDNGWQGKAGYWHIGLHSTDPSTRITGRGMRMWRIPQPGERPGFMLVQRNVYDAKLPLGPLTQREQDGLYQAEYYRRREDAAYEPNLRAHGDMPSWAARKLAVIEHEAYVQVMNTVPMKLLTKEDVPDKRLAFTTAVPSVWSTELFYGDGEHKWSCLGLWDLLGGGLINVACIVERHVKIPNMDAKLDFNDLGVPVERPSLPENPSEWLAPGTPGTRKTLEVGPDGLFYSLPDEPCTWDPATSLSVPGHRLVLLPDSQYIYLPEQAPGATGKALEYQAGGRMRSVEGGFQRQCVRFDDAGSFASLAWERYVPNSA